MSSASGEASGFASMATNSAEEGGNSTVKKKRNLPGTPDPDAEVIALSPKTLMATNRFSCEVCGKGFQRDQNLQLHRRGHNLPWKLKQRVDGIEVKKKVYVCPEISCVHHDPSRALGDLTGIKKHFSRKHGEKKWKCEKCSKRYAVHSDWKAHQKVCGTREYRCDCGTLFSRRDSFITHRAFCDALAEESARATVHKQVEIQHHQQQQQSSSGGGGHNDETNTLSGPMRGGDLSNTNTAIDAPSTPRSHKEVTDPSVKLAFEPNPPSSVSPTWRIQDGREKAYKPSKGPALSLCLGTGPGPGPPPGLACLTESTTNPVSMPVTNPSNWAILQDTNHQARPPPLPDGNLGMFTSMLTSGNNDPEQQVYGAGPSNGISDLPMLNSGVMLDTPSSIPRFSLPSGGGAAIMSPNYFRNPSKPSSHHRHHTSSGQMPATALLQKAAMMGATASNPYLLRNFGLRGNVSPMVSSGSGQDSWAGPTLSSSSSWRGYAPPVSSTQQGGAGHHTYDYGAYRQGGGDSLRTPMSYDGQLGSVEDSMNSRSALFANVSYSSRNPRSFAGDSSWHSDMLLGTSSKVLNNPTPTTPTPMVGLESPLGREKNEGDRTTLDFLGVGSHGGAEGSTGSIPHQRIPGVSSSYPGTTKMETTREGTPKY